MRTHEWDVGEVVHGFAGGAFGRDSYDCRRVEAVGHDWIVTRNARGGVEFVSEPRMPTREDGENRDYCHSDAFVSCPYA
jgi:hypothetical protein